MTKKAKAVRPPIEKIATVYDEATGSWFDVFSFVTIRGELAELTVLRATNESRSSFESSF
ncbi:hypothetical protein SAMN05216548_1061 [Faunimonas pinastri]|uniref:Uncharacterized protein n=1 Tax=Faunimonas pinastri TaxID=1855383 RepID=A0A1H9HCU1_9HYPH|nr:hypothetical protein [Faunimonas pinastri]SEQ60143.1 hypothetical protein SAMN05216548_1061 [Faunimonas pinastri]